MVFGWFCVHMHMKAMHTCMCTGSHTNTDSCCSAHCCSRCVCHHTHTQARAALALELFVSQYSPIKHVPQLTCPILFVAVTEDVLCPVDQVHRAVALAQRGQLLSRDCTHFELYRGALFEGLIGEQLKFFQQHTGLAP